jgi:hypothetical protein
MLRPTALSRSISRSQIRIGRSIFTRDARVKRDSDCHDLEIHAVRLGYRHFEVAYSTGLALSSHFFSIAAGVSEGAGGSGSPRPAPSAAPISHRSRKPPISGCRLIQPRTCCWRVLAAVSPGSTRQPFILPVAGSGSVHCRSGLRTARATTDRRMEAAHIRDMCIVGSGSTAAG